MTKRQMELAAQFRFEEHSRTTPQWARGRSKGELIEHGLRLTPADIKVAQQFPNVVLHIYPVQHGTGWTITHERWRDSHSYTYKHHSHAKKAALKMAAKLLERCMIEDAEQRLGHLG